MSRYRLSPDAAQDLVGIWSHLRTEAGIEIADRVEAEIRKKCASLATAPGIGH